MKKAPKEKEYAIATCEKCQGYGSVRELVTKSAKTKKVKVWVVVKWIKKSWVFWAMETNHSEARSYLIYRTKENPYKVVSATITYHV